MTKQEASILSKFDALLAENATLKERVKELEGALKPFALIITEPLNLVYSLEQHGMDVVVSMCKLAARILEKR